MPPLESPTSGMIRDMNYAWFNLDNSTLYTCLMSVALFSMFPPHRALLNFAGLTLIIATGRSLIRFSVNLVLYAPGGIDNRNSERLIQVT